MTIRVMTIADYPAIRALWESSDGVGLSASDSFEGVQKVLDRNPGMSFVAEVDGEVVGTILVGHDGRRGLVHHLVVASAVRRRGIGCDLVKRGLAALRAVGIDKAHLLVFCNNEDGLGFWRRIGAVERVDLSLFSMVTAE